MTAEYSEWLKGVSQAKFELPMHILVDKEEQDRRAAVAKKKREDTQLATDEYFENVRRMEEKHHERIMAKVQAKHERDALFNQGAASAAEALQAKLQAENQRAKEIEMKSRKELKETYTRVKA